MSQSQLPQPPGHPEPHSMKWSELELAAIKEYGEQCARAALAAKVPAECERLREHAVTLANTTYLTTLELCAKVCEAHFNHEAKDCAEEIRALANAATPAPASEANPVYVSVERERVWIKRGKQSFMVAYEAETDEERQWYAEQLRGALAGFTPDVKTEPAQAQQAAELERMTAHRAAFFMERFLKEEKMLGPNEQAALRFVIAQLEAKPEAQQPLSNEQADEILLELDSMARDYGHYEYGLPLHTEEHREGFREVLRRIVFIASGEASNG